MTFRQKTFDFKYTLVAVLLMSLSLQAAPDNKDHLQLSAQFMSDNAAVILGLEELKTVEKKDIELAARRLTSQYHPDRFMNKEKYSDEDRKIANAITVKIQLAKKTLVNYIAINPNYDPSKDSASSSDFNSSKRPQNKNESYSWDEMFKSKNASAQSYGSSDSHEIVTDTHYGSSLRGTLFEFLHNFPGFTEAIIPFEITSTNVNEPDVVMIIEPKNFPHIEFRFISKRVGGMAPQVMGSVWAKYVRGHHQGNSGYNLIDAIVFPDGRYLMNALPTGRPNIPYIATAVDKTSKRIYIQSTMMMFLTEMESTGYSTGRSFSMLEKSAFDFLPSSSSSAVPEWKKVKVIGNQDVIKLGYDKNSCEGKLR